MAISSGAAGARGFDWLSNWAGAVAVFALFAGSAAVCAHLGVMDATAYFHEDGLVELCTPPVFVLVAILYVVWMRRIGLSSYVPPFILLLMAARELDGDKWFTAKSLLSTGYYFDNPGVSYGERVLVGIIVGAMGIVILRFFWNARSRIVAALRDLDGYTRSILLGFVLLGASLCLDGLGRKVSAFSGYHVSRWVEALAGITEETAELGMAVAFAVALLQLRYDPRRNQLPRA